MPRNASAVSERYEGIGHGTSFSSQQKTSFSAPSETLVKPTLVLPLGSETSDGIVIGIPTVCDACPSCQDLCDNHNCESCKSHRSAQLSEGLSERPKAMTICQVQRQCRQGRVLLVANRKVYDAAEVLKWHPGGSSSILNAVGRDSTEDLEFHKASGKGLWEKYVVCGLVKCKHAQYGYAKSPECNTCNIS